MFSTGLMKYLNDLVQVCNNNHDLENQVSN